MSDIHPPSAPSADDITFRERIATIDAEGKRKFIYPKKPSGRFTRARTFLSWFLLAFLFGAPFIRIGGEPLLLLNILERKFVIFGVVFWPQDFYLFGLVMIATVVFIFLFTAVYGRLFCGWICPQTVFLEMVFRKIEYLIDGDAQQQRMLATAPWSPAKIGKRALKLAIFFALSFLIGNTFLAYIVGVDRLYAIVTDPPSQHIAGLVAMLVFSGMFFFVFTWFREQACVLVCPYGRLQSVLLDENSVVITYDFKRGEPRRKMRKNASREGLGDCVDCGQCVFVCPTGIDIRNGTQLECVNCTACIDACDSVMDNVGLPRGLVRYSSHASIKSGATKLLTPRVIGYTVVLSLLVVLIVYLFAARNEVEATVLRAPGTLYQEKPGGIISNLYTMKVINKTSTDVAVSARLLSPEGTLALVGAGTMVPSGGFAQAVFFIDIQKRSMATASVPVVIGLYTGDRLLEKIETTFVGPAPGSPARDADDTRPSDDTPKPEGGERDEDGVRH
jgi:cytochrome c oxidase accessory protein FixG